MKNELIKDVETCKIGKGTQGVISNITLSKMWLIDKIENQGHFGNGIPKI